MEFSFAGVDDAEATLLARELKFGLIGEGVPPQAVSLRPSSEEHMGDGSTLFASLELAAHALGAVGYIACFVKCIHEVASKHGVHSIVIRRDGISIEIPVSAPDAIGKAIGELNNRKTES